MLWNNIFFVLLLLAEVAIGPCIRQLKNRTSQQRASAIAGFLFIWMASGWHTLHPTVLVTINSIIVLYTSKRICHILSFIFCFSYLAIVRLGYFLGMPSPLPCGSAVLMFMTLKMVGLAFEVHDSYVRRTKNGEKTLEEDYLSINPLMGNIFCYAFCHAGILVGPYFRYRTYWDSFHTEYSNNIDYMNDVLSRLKFVPLYGFLFLIIGFGFPAEYAASDEMLGRSFWYHVWYMSPATFVYRLRLYIGFILGECQCIAAGIGVYPVDSRPRSGQGPTLLQHMKTANTSSSHQQLKVDFETIRNVNVFQSEFVMTTKELGWNWNITVQYWLYAYVYKRIPLSWKSYRSPITMLMSAFWHGIHPAYYFWAITISLMFLTEEALIKTFRHDAFPGGKEAFDWFCWFFRTQMMFYNGMAFVLLNTKAIFVFWSSISFIGHVLLALVYFISIKIFSYQEKYSQLKRSN